MDAHTGAQAFQHNHTEALGKFVWEERAQPERHLCGTKAVASTRYLVTLRISCNGYTCLSSCICFFHTWKLHTPLVSDISTFNSWNNDWPDNNKAITNVKDIGELTVSDTFALVLVMSPPLGSASTPKLAHCSRSPVPLPCSVELCDSCKEHWVTHS